MSTSTTHTDRYTFEDDPLKQRERIKTAHSEAMENNRGVVIPKEALDKYRGIYNDPTIKLANAIKDYYKKNLHGKTVEVEIRGGIIEVAFSSDGRDKSTKGTRMSPARAATFEYLENLLMNGTYAYSEKNRKADNEKYVECVPHFHHFVNNANIDGIDVPVRIQVREMDMPDGAKHRYYTHGFTKNNGDASSGLAGESAGSGYT